MQSSVNIGLQVESVEVTPGKIEQTRKNFKLLVDELEHLSEVFLTEENKETFEKLTADCIEFAELLFEGETLTKENLGDFSQIIRQRIDKLKKGAQPHQLMTMECEIVLQEVDKLAASLSIEPRTLQSHSKEENQAILRLLKEKSEGFARPYELVIDRKILEYVGLLLEQLKAFHDKYGDERKNQQYFNELQKIELGLLKLVFAKKKIDTDDVMMASILTTMTTQFKAIRNAKTGMENLNEFLDAYDEAKKALKDLSIFFKNMLAEQHKNPFEGIEKFEKFVKMSDRFSDSDRQVIENAVQFFKQDFSNENNAVSKRSRPSTVALTRVHDRKELIEMADSLGVAPVRMDSTMKILKRVGFRHPVEVGLISIVMLSAFLHTVSNLLKSYNDEVNEKFSYGNSKIDLPSLMWGTLGFVCLLLVGKVSYQVWPKSPKPEPSRVEEVKEEPVQQKQSKPDVETGSKNSDSSDDDYSDSEDERKALTGGRVPRKYG